jgi:nucleotide-binding universal stress UspA family protein
MSKKILFPTDFSVASKNAFIYALQLADSINAEIVTIHVYELPQAHFVNAAAYLHEIYDVTELATFENYRDEVPALRTVAEVNNLGHIKMSHVLIAGDTVSQIRKMAENDYFDIVIMGTKGGTSFRESVFGTVATKVMNEVKSLILVIPADCNYQAIKKILFLTQYKSVDTESFKKIVSFSKTFNAHLDCLRIRSLNENDADDAREDWKQLADSETVNFHLIAGSDTEGLTLEFIKSNAINIVSMHVYHKNFFEKFFETSISKKLALHINIPLLAIHE